MRILRIMRILLMHYALRVVNFMNKKTLILGGILAVLIILAYFYQGPIKRWQSNLAQPNNFLAKADVDQINKIEIINNKQETVLEKYKNRWKISGTKDFYVKESLANRLEDGIRKLSKAEIELVSNSKDKKSDFQTGAEKGVKVKLIQDAQVVADFIVGKRGADFMSAYISEANSDNTYIIKSDISGLFKSDWHDKTIFANEKEKIVKIRFQYPNREFTIEKQSGNIEQWHGVLPYKFSVNQDKIDKILNIMSNLTAIKIPEQIFKGTGLEKNLIIVQATGDGVDNTLMIGEDNGEELYYVKKGDIDNIYLIFQEQRDELDKNIWDLR